MGKGKNRNRRFVGKPKGTSKSTSATTNINTNTSSQNPTLSPCGLNNVGNTCFFNSTLQSIASTSRHLSASNIQSFLSESLGDAPGKITTALVNVITTMSRQASKSVNPSELLNALGKQYPQFKGRNQQDSHEAFICVMSSVKEERDQSIKNATESSNCCPPLSNYYNGKIASIVTCMECKTRTAATEDFFDLSLEIPGSESLNVYKILPPKKGKSNKGNAVTASTKMSKDKEVDVLATNNDTHDCEKSLKSKPELGMEDDKPELDMEQENTVVASNEILDNASDDISESMDGTKNESKDVILDNESDERNNEDEESDKCIQSEDEPMDAVIASFSDLQLSSEVAGDGIVESLMDDTNDHCSNIILNCDLIEPDIALPRPKNTDIVLTDCLDAFSKLEILKRSEGNGFSCNNCMKAGFGQTDATKRLLLLEGTIPTTVVIHLKRLLPGGKFNEHVRFPLTLNMNNYIARKPRPTVEYPELQDHQVESDHELVAVIVHQGTGRGGHYIAYVKHEVSGTWFYTSDSSVRPCLLRDVLACQAYMLFYLQETRPQESDQHEGNDVKDEEGHTEVNDDDEDDKEDEKDETTESQSNDTANCATKSLKVHNTRSKTQQTEK